MVPGRTYPNLRQHRLLRLQWTCDCETSQTPHIQSNLLSNSGKLSRSLRMEVDHVSEDRMQETSGQNSVCTMRVLSNM